MKVKLKNGFELYNGDCLELMRDMPSNSVDAIATDPPYSSGGQFRSDRTNTTKNKYVDSRNFVQYPEFAGDNRDQRSFLFWSVLWISEALRLVKPGGVICLFSDWRQLPTTTDALQAGGFVWRGIAVWDKTEAARPWKGKFRNQCEYIVWGSNGPMVQEGECFPGVWRQSVLSEEKFHIAGKPVNILKNILKIVKPGGVVLDNFMGSGTAGIAAHEMGLQYIGIEKEKEYFDISVERIKKAQQQALLFGE